jgi:hypothetical protein
MGLGKGGKGWFQAWEMMTSVYPFLRCQLDTIEVTGSEEAPTVFTRATTSTQLTREALEQLFPHIVNEEEILRQLVGKHVRFPVKAAYHFSEENLVILTEVEMDFVSTFYGILQNPFDLCKLLPVSNASIEQQYRQQQENHFIFQPQKTISSNSLFHHQKKEEDYNSRKSHSSSTCSSTCSSSSTSSDNRLGIGFLLS